MFQRRFLSGYQPYPHTNPGRREVVNAFLRKISGHLVPANQAPLGNPLVLGSSNVVTVQWSMGQWKYVESSEILSPTGLHVVQP